MRNKVEVLHLKNLTAGGIIESWAIKRNGMPIREVYNQFDAIQLKNKLEVEHGQR